MHRKLDLLMPLQMCAGNHPRVHEFQVISMVLDEHSNLS